MVGYFTIKNTTLLVVGVLLKYWVANCDLSCFLEMGLGWCECEELNIKISDIPFKNYLSQRGSSLVL